MPLVLGGTVMPENADVKAPIAWAVHDDDKENADITGNTLIITKGETVRIIATIENGNCGTPYEQTFTINATCEQIAMHQIQGTISLIDNYDATIPGENRPINYEPGQTLKAWVIYNHHQCGDIDIRVEENASPVGYRSPDLVRAEGIPLDGCGYLILFELGEESYELSGNPNTSFDFHFYLRAQPCPGIQGIQGDKSRRTKGDVQSPLIYDYGIIAESVLPISLLHFSGICKNGNVQLSWITASETNNDYFTLERSANAVQWTAVADIRGAGNSNSVLQYSYVDYAESGTHYYRLKQTDYNGDYEYFNPVVVSCPKNQEDIRIYPNPTNGMIYIQTATGASTEFRLYSVEGRLLKNGNGSEVNLSEYAKGVYFLKINDTTFKVVRE
jgi:hypothetical protein